MPVPPIESIIPYASPPESTLAAVVTSPNRSISDWIDTIRDWKGEVAISFCHFLLMKKYITKDALLKAMQESDKHRPLIGQIALEKKMIDLTQIMNIIQEQVKTREAFGEIAVRLGVLKRSELLELLNLQDERRLNPAIALIKTGGLSPELMAFYAKEYEKQSEY